MGELAGKQRANLVTISEWRLYELLGNERELDEMDFQNIILNQKVANLQLQLQDLREDKKTEEK